MRCFFLYRPQQAVNQALTAGLATRPHGLTPADLRSAYKLPSLSTSNQTVAVSIPLGLMMGRSRAVASFFNPLLMITYPVPKAALMPIIMLWLGVGDIAKTLVIFLGVSLPVIYHSFEGAKGVEEKMLWSGAAMGLSAAQRMVRIVLPAALPEILTGCRTGLVLALITMITSEMIARQSGAGNILFNALDMGQYDTVFAMIIIVGAMGIGLDAAFENLRGRLVRWSEPRFDMPLSFS